jgi:hypothetical protein
MNAPTTPTSAVDSVYADYMAAETLEQIAYEAYERAPCADLWLAHQAASRQRETSHARYLDVLIAEQHALAQI